jgi:hypothetical protein
MSVFYTTGTGKHPIIAALWGGCWRPIQWFRTRNSGAVPEHFCRLTRWVILCRILTSQTDMKIHFQVCIRQQ